MLRRGSWRVVATILVALGLGISGLGPLGGLDPVGAAVTPGVFAARLSCDNPKHLEGTGVVTVTTPNTLQDVVDAELFVRAVGNTWVEAIKANYGAAPTVSFTFTVAMPADVAHLALVDFRLGGGSGVTPDNTLLASVNGVTVRAAQGCTEPDIDVTISAATRVCTAPSVLRGTVAVVGTFTGTLALDLYNGATRVPAIVGAPHDGVRDWTANLGSADLPSALTYEVTTSLPTVRRVAAGSMAVPTCIGVRLFGDDAIDTSIAISKAAYPEAGSASAVVLARSDFFSDALAGGPLAAQRGGPMLITPGASQSPTLLPKVLTEINRVLDDGDTVYILGGPLALSTAIDSTLVANGYDVVRVFGQNQFGTAVEIADELGNPDVIFEATGLHFADALSAVPAAVGTGGAILLTNGKQQAPETADYLDDHPDVTRYAIGGPLAAAGADPGAIGDLRPRPVRDVRRGRRLLLRRTHRDRHRHRS